MGLWVFAIGYAARARSEGALVEDFCTRAHKMGKELGFPAVATGRAGCLKAALQRCRHPHEGRGRAAGAPGVARQGRHPCRAAGRARARACQSEDFAELLGVLRDVGTQRIPGVP